MTENIMNNLGEKNVHDFNQQEVRNEDYTSNVNLTVQTKSTELQNNKSNDENINVQECVSNKVQDTQVQISNIKKNSDLLKEKKIKKTIVGAITLGFCFLGAFALIFLVIKGF